jgi:tRNA-dihydrouridine synthase
MLCRIAQFDYVTAMSDAAKYLGTDGAQFQIGRQGRAILAPVKMRLGWDAQSINATELARLAEAKGIAILPVHTRCQFYAATADWRAIGKVKQSNDVAANGDCQSLADAMLANLGRTR